MKAKREGGRQGEKGIRRKVRGGENGRGQEKRKETKKEEKRIRDWGRKKSG